MTVVSAGYGYDIRAEVVGEAGALAPADTGEVTVTRQGRRGSRVPANWRERFGGAFDAEFTDWLGAVAAGTTTGPGSWDGYAAAPYVAAKAGLAGLTQNVIGALD